MTRHITAHKGGRTARIPSGRILPQTLERIRAEMQQRGMSWADMIEATWGSSDTAASRANGAKGGRPKKEQAMADNSGYVRCTKSGAYIKNVSKDDAFDLALSDRISGDEILCVMNDATGKQEYYRKSKK